MQEFIPLALNSLPNRSSGAIWESNSWRMEAWRTGVNHSTAHNEHRDIIRGRELTDSNRWVGYGSIWPSWRARGKSFCAPMSAVGQNKHPFTSDEIPTVRLLQGDTFWHVRNGAMTLQGYYNSYQIWLRFLCYSLTHDLNTSLSSNTRDFSGLWGNSASNSSRKGSSCSGSHDLHCELNSLHYWKYLFVEIVFLFTILNRGNSLLFSL